MKYAVTLLLATVVVGIFLIQSHLKARYQLAFDGQTYERCLPFWIFGVEREEIKGAIKVNELIRFVPERDRGQKIVEGSSITKLVLAKEGDRIKIEQDKLYINNRFFSKLHLIKALKAKEGDFDTEYTIPKGKFFVGGTSPGSFDSRYWGLVDRKEIKGRVHALL